MDNFEKIKEIVHHMILEQQQYFMVAQEKNEFEVAGEHLRKKTTLEMVYNKILQIANNNPVVADEMLEAIWKAKNTVSGE